MPDKSNKLQSIGAFIITALVVIFVGYIIVTNLISMFTNLISNPIPYIVGACIIVALYLVAVFVAKIIQYINIEYPGIKKFFLSITGMRLVKIYLASLFVALVVILIFPVSFPLIYTIIYRIAAFGLLCAFFQTLNIVSDYIRENNRAQYNAGYQAGIRSALEVSNASATQTPAQILPIDINSIIRINKLKDCTTAETIHALHYHHQGKHYNTTVGDSLNHLSESTYAILKGNQQYYLCTENHGALRGKPVIIKQHNIISVL